jgi:hypothetical protein
MFVCMNISCARCEAKDFDCSKKSAHNDGIFLLLVEYRVMHSGHTGFEPGSNAVMVLVLC